MLPPSFGSMLKRRLGILLASCVFHPGHLVHATPSVSKQCFVMTVTIAERDIRRYTMTGHVCQVANVYSLFFFFL